MSEHEVKWAGNPVKIDRSGQNARVLALASGPGAHEPVKLLASASVPLGGLLLERAP